MSEVGPHYLVIQHGQNCSCCAQDTCHICFLPMPASKSARPDPFICATCLEPLDEMLRRLAFPFMRSKENDQ